MLDSGETLAQFQTIAYLEPLVVVDNPDMAEKRAAYRSTRGLGDIKVSMALAGDDYVLTKLVDLSAKGAAVAVAVPAMRVAALPVGTNVLLKFEITELDTIEDIAAVVRDERDSDDARVFGLEIADWKVLHSKLPPKLFAAFNRRRHFRVALPTEPATGVAGLTQDGRSFAATLADISVGGCLLVAQPDAAPNQGEAVQLSFCLPGSAEELEMRGTVKGTWGADNTLRCGIEFDAEATGFRANEQHISVYVIHRQRELKKAI